MIIIPRLLNGAKTAERVPKHILTLPSRIFFHSVYFSFALSLECITAILSLNTFLNFFSIYGVNIISGTKMIASFPALITASTSFI